MIPPRRSIPIDYEVDPAPGDGASDAASNTGRDWPAFADDDAGRESYVGPAAALILAVIAMALVFLIILGWRVPA